MKDFEAQLTIFLLGLKEEKEKKYSPETSKQNVVYVFDNFDEYYSYFMNNGAYNIEKIPSILNDCKLKTTKKGSILALKGLCDHSIKGLLALQPKTGNMAWKNSLKKQNKIIPFPKKINN